MKNQIRITAMSRHNLLLFIRVISVLNKMMSDNAEKIIAMLEVKSMLFNVNGGKCPPPGKNYDNSGFTAR
ncbi:hypothetical protein RQN30_03490 [Arcanobacterium hippocoleae]